MPPFWFRLLLDVQLYLVSQEMDEASTPDRVEMLSDMDHMDLPEPAAASSAAA